MADDLNTEIKIGADASGVEAGVGRAKRSLADLGASAKKAGQDAGVGMASVGAGGDQAAKDVERATKSMQGSLQRLLAEQKAGAKGSREYWEALADTRGISRNAIKPILDQIDAAKSKTLQAKAAADSWTASLDKVGPLVAAAFSGAAITGFLGKVVSVQREFDVLNSSLKTVTGSNAAAEREMAWLKDFAKETPFGLAQATQGFVKMKALGLDPTRAALTSFGNTASAMGKDLNQMIEAVADASTGEFERLKEFGIKAKKEGDQVSLTFQGVTTTIQNSAADITKYLEDIGNTSFGGAMEERAKTLDGTIAALGDTWDELFRTVSTNNVGSLIFDSVTLANGVLEEATTILRAMGGAAQDASRDTGALSTIQNGIATVFETVAVLGANLKYVLVQIGNEIGGLAAQVVQAAQFNFSGVAAIRRQMVADAEAARREVDATTERILRARKAQEEYARYATRNASAATDPRRVDLGGSTTRATGNASSDAAKAVKEPISEYDKLIQKLGQEIPKAAAEAEAAQMGYNKAQTEFLALVASPAWATFTNQQRATVAALFENKIASEEAADAAKTLAKANLDAAASREKYIASLAAGLNKIQADTAAQIEATERMGLSKEAIAELDAAKLEMLATDLELQAIKAMDRNLDQQTYDALKKQAAAYRELGIAKKGGAAKEAALEMEKANAEAAKKAQEDWERAAEQINSSLTDALLRGFESGKDFAKNLRDTVVNMFKTMVLRPVISAIINPISGAITGALGVAGTANAGTSALGTVGNLASGARLFGGLGAFGGGLSGGFGGLMGSLGLAATGTTLGGALSAGSIALQSGNILGGLGTFAGALGPIVAGLGLVASLLKSGETRQGGQYRLDGGRAVLVAGPSGGEIEGQSVRAAIDAAAGGINALLKQLGSSASLAAFQAGLESSDKSRGGVFAGGTLSTGQTFGMSGGGSNYDGTMYDPHFGFSGDSKAMLQAFTAELAQTTLQALQAATDIPKAVRDQLDAQDIKGLSAEAATALATSIAQQAQDVATFREAMESLPFENLRNLSYDAAAALGTAAGGLGTLAQSLTSFANNTAFYTQAEIDARAMAELKATFAEFGQEMPTTTAGYRALVEHVAALAPTSEEAAKGLAALLASAEAFARISANAANATYNASSSSQSASFNAANNPADLAELQARFAAYNVAAPTNMFEYRALMAQAAAAAPTDALAAKGLEELNASLNAASQLFSAAAQAAAPNWGPSFQNAVDGGGGASEKALADWKSATDSIKSTMDDLRKTLIDETKPSLAALQAEFAVAAARAKAGDAMAAASLPDIAKAISAAGREQASSALEAALITARAAQALQDVLDARRVASAAPSYMGLEGKAAVFPEYERRPTWLSQPEIDENMRYAQVSYQHLLAWYFPWMKSQSPELLPPDRASAPNPVMEPDRMYIFSNGPGGNGPGGNATEIADALAAMAERLAAIEAATRATQNATRSTADVLERASRGSQPLTTQVTA